MKNRNIKSFQNNENIQPLNKTISSEKDLDILFEQLSEREELACFGNGCTGNGCGINYKLDQIFLKMKIGTYILKNNLNLFYRKEGLNH